MFQKLRERLGRGRADPIQAPKVGPLSHAQPIALQKPGEVENPTPNTKVPRKEKTERRIELLKKAKRLQQIM